jgi:hypothetical protein
MIPKTLATIRLSASIRFHPLPSAAIRCHPLIRFHPLPVSK